MKRFIFFLSIIYIGLFTNSPTTANDTNSIYLPILSNNAASLKINITDTDTVFLSKAVVVDDKNQRLFIGGWHNEAPLITVYSNTGSLLYAINTHGRFNYIPTQDWLLVDTPAGDLQVINATSGTLLQTIVVGEHSDSYVSASYWSSDLMPAFDTQNQQIYYYRTNQVYAVDTQSSTILGSHPFEIPAQTCGTPDNTFPPITKARYEDNSRLLYVSFLTAWCTPHANHTLLAHNVATGQEISRKTYARLAWTTHDSALFGATWSANGIGYRWRWQDGIEVWEGAGGTPLTISSWIYNANPHQIYEGVANNMLAITDANTMMPLPAIPNAPTGHLVASSSMDNTLYFIENGQLIVWALP